ncbi:MAG: 4Fe-4S dicluster domain-containing protein [Chlorobi bacterium]|nr:4Fe-4S dicluster domain-containing protein [Chlorobiota bacterium]
MATQVPSELMQESMAHFAAIVGEESGEQEHVPPILDSPLSRRSFMAMLSAAMAVTAAACRRPDYKLVPAVKNPEYAIPGVPLYYSTCYMHKNVVHPLLVRVREGRPVKVEGNDLHPIVGGKSSALIQATLFELYDPERIRPIIVGRRPGVTPSGNYSTPANAIAQIAKAIRETAADGKQVRILLDEHCSPMLATLAQMVEQHVPNTAVVVFPWAIADGAAEATKAMAGSDGVLVPNLERADVIVSCDADFLGADRNAVYLTRGFASRRRPTEDNPTMSRFIAVEGRFSQTGAAADRRVVVHPSQYEGFLTALYNEIARAKGAATLSHPVAAADAAASVARELLAAGERGCVLVGEHLSSYAHAVGLAINALLGSIGQGKVFEHVLPMSGAKRPAVEALRDDLRSERVGAVLFSGVNPEYTADDELRTLLRRVPHRFAHSLIDDETAQQCTITIPAAHQYESWGDAVAFDGSYCIQQPLIAPLPINALSTGELLFGLIKEFAPDAVGGAEKYFDFFKQQVLRRVGGESQWEQLLRKGFVEGTPTTVGQVNLSALASFRPTMQASDLAVLVVPSSSVYDGSHANNPWLLECPDPVTKHTWENVAVMSKGTAEKLGVGDEDVVTVTVGGKAIELPVLTQYGMHDGVVVTTLGYGRNAGKVAAGYGQNAYALLASGTVGYYAATVTRTGKRSPIARTQKYFHAQFTKQWEPDAPEDKFRPIVHELTLDEFKRGKQPKGLEFPSTGSDGRFEIPLNIVEGYQYKGHKWGMVIDLSACTGCNACVVACESENNIPPVGKDQVMRGRVMHWIRLDRYYLGTPDDPRSVVEPMLCQHCENAPCENVCPVAATVHSPEGLNEMVYNRCVGTRYCLNNCPYKVRRFNFLAYFRRFYEEKLGTDQPHPLDLAMNPDVTVRMRGVMEKCTFCVQRINEAKYHAKDAGHSRVPDGAFQTACEQACPASAITFGNLNDSNSRVSKLRTSQRSFLVLEELNVRPSVTYLAKVRNTTTVTA